MIAKWFPFEIFKCIALNFKTQILSAEIIANIQNFKEITKMHLTIQHNMKQ